MKYLLIYFFLIPICLYGQESVLLNKKSIEIQTEIDLAKGKLDIISLPSKTKISLKNYEIQIDYLLSSLGEDGHYYNVYPEFFLDDKPIFLRPFQDFRGDWGDNLNVGMKELNWVNLLKRYVQVQGRLTIRLNIEKWGAIILPYDCDLGVPKFTAKQQRLHLIAGGVGIASIGLGQLLKSQSNNIYQNTYLNSNSLDEARPLYLDANKKHQQHLVLTYAGAGILLVDITMYLIKRSKVNKQKKLYDRYCKDKRIGFRIDPAFNTSFNTASVGLKMTWDLNNPIK